jgi:hypothetical protein
MNNGTTEISAITRNARAPASTDEPETLKRELMKAEVRLAKARATVVSAESDTQSPGHTAQSRRGEAGVARSLAEGSPPPCAGFW